VGHNKQISEELRITFHKIYKKITNKSFFIIQWEIPFMYYEFDYKL